MTIPQPSGDDPNARHYVVQCRDRADSAALRTATLAAHRAYVDTWESSITLSGPLITEGGEVRIGQFYVLHIESRSAAEEFIANDPFTKAGLFTSVEVTRIQLRFLGGRRSG